MAACARHFETPESVEDKSGAGGRFQVRTVLYPVDTTIISAGVRCKGANGSCRARGRTGRAAGFLAKTPGSVIPHQTPRRQGGRADNSASPTPAAVRRPRGDRTMANEPPARLAWAQPRLVPCGRVVSLKRHRRPACDLVQLYLPPLPAATCGCGPGASRSVPSKTL